MRLARAAMATRFELLLLGGDPVHLRAAGEAALEEIGETERELSRFDSASALSHVQREALTRPVRVPPALFACLAACRDVFRASGGAFDPAFDPAAPEPATLEAVELSAERGTVRFLNPAVRLDLGGLGKGAALDRAAAVLREAGVECAFLHGGTSTALGLGDPRRAVGAAHPWTVALPGAAASAGPITLEDRALSFSSASAGGAGAGRPHVVDPLLGARVPAGRQACVVGPCAELADAWSTALIAGAVPNLLPPEFELVHSTP